MGLAPHIKPIRRLKANATEALVDPAAAREPVIITQRGEAKAVVQDVASCEATRETLALLKILAPGLLQVAVGRVKPFEQAVAEIRVRGKRR